MLNLQRLRLLQELSVRKTVAATAEAFYMSPSAVSQQLAVLEREAGVELLAKDGRGVKLTEAAFQLIRNSEDIFAAMEKAEADLEAASRGVVGTIHLSAFPTAARGIVIPMAAYFLNAYPNLNLHVLDYEPEEALPALTAGELDISLYYAWDLLPSITPLGVQTWDILSESVYLALPLDHHLAKQNRPIALNELAQEDWIVGREATSMMQLVTAATARAGYQPQVRVQTMDFQVILSAVSAGLGIGFIPPMGFIGGISGVTFRRLKDYELHRTVRVAIRKGSEHNPGIATVLSELNLFANEMRARLVEIDRTIGT